MALVVYSLENSLYPDPAEAAPDRSQPARTKDTGMVSVTMYDGVTGGELPIQNLPSDQLISITIPTTAPLAGNKQKECQWWRQQGQA